MEKYVPKISDEKILSSTGKHWENWFALIDNLGGKSCNHKEIVTLLKANSNLSDWWQQSVTVEYEIARGKRKPHEMVDGFQISKSKTLHFPIDTVYQAWKQPKKRSEWIDDPGFTVRKANENKSLRITWIDGTTHVDVHFYPKGDKTQVSINHKKIETGQNAVSLKNYWEKQMKQLALYISKDAS